MATRSFSPSCSTSRCKPHFTSGSLSGSSIEPETSTRKTRLLGGLLRLVDGPGGDADPGQPVLGVPGAAGDLGVNGEGILARHSTEERRDRESS